MHQAKCLWETRIDPKKTVRPSEHDRPDVAAARVAWHAAAPTWDVAHLVFLDETGITTNLLRRYGRAPRGARVHDHAPCGRWQTSTFLAALRVTGLQPTARQELPAYIDQILVPTLHPGDIVIADNLGAHKVAGIQRALQAAGATLWYLPPYSPDLNPIELCFAKLKALVRTARCRSTERFRRPRAWSGRVSILCPWRSPRDDPEAASIALQRLSEEPGHATEDRSGRVCLASWRPRR